MNRDYGRHVNRKHLSREWYMVVRGAVEFFGGRQCGEYCWGAMNERGVRHWSLMPSCGAPRRCSCAAYHQKALLHPRHHLSHKMIPLLLSLSVLQCKHTTPRHFPVTPLSYVALILGAGDDIAALLLLQALPTKIPTLPILCVLSLFLCPVVCDKILFTSLHTYIKYKVLVPYLTWLAPLISRISSNFIWPLPFTFFFFFFINSPPPSHSFISNITFFPILLLIRLL